METKGKIWELFLASFKSMQPWSSTKVIEMGSRVLREGERTWERKAASAESSSLINWKLPTNQHQEYIFQTTETKIKTHKLKILNPPWLINTPTLSLTWWRNCSTREKPWETQKDDHQMKKTLVTHVENDQIYCRIV